MVTHTCPDERKGVDDFACSNRVTAQCENTELLPEEWDELLMIVGEMGTSGAKGKKGVGGDRGSGAPLSLGNDRGLPTVVDRKCRSGRQLTALDEINIKGDARYGQAYAVVPVFRHPTVWFGYAATR